MRSILLKQQDELGSLGFGQCANVCCFKLSSTSALLFDHMHRFQCIWVHKSWWLCTQEMKGSFLVESYILAVCQVLNVRGGGVTCAQCPECGHGFKKKHLKKVFNC